MKGLKAWRDFSVALGAGLNTTILIAVRACGTCARRLKHTKFWPKFRQKLLQSPMICAKKAKVKLV